MNRYVRDSIALDFANLTGSVAAVIESLAEESRKDAEHAKERAERDAEAANSPAIV